MVYQPPSGARDLLPLDVAQKSWIENRLETIFHRWGYHRIITSTVEHLETLMAGGAIEQSTVIELQGTPDQRLGLRPEVTASIARAAVTRINSVSYPQRLYYTANVFRRASQGSHGGQQEFYQAGIELLGSGGLMADSEILLLLVDALGSLGLNNWHLVLGEAGLTKSLLQRFPEELRPQIRQAIAHLDRITLETLPLPDDLRQWALQLMDLRGKPADVLQTVANLGLTPYQQISVNNLKSLIGLLEETLATNPGAPPITLDLSLIQTFDYYTGIVFEVVSDTAQQRQVIGQGGRYDHLLGVYHPDGKTFPGIGFILEIEAIHQVLLPTGQLPEHIPPSDWLVVPTSPQAASAAFAYAQKIRESANLIRVEVDLDIHADPEAVRTIARRRHISRIAWITPAGLPEIEALH